MNQEVFYLNFKIYLTITGSADPMYKILKPETPIKEIKKHSPLSDVSYTQESDLQHLGVGKGQKMPTGQGCNKRQPC